jgi:hypothetical protein
MTLFGYLEMERICIRNLLQENDFPVIIVKRECDLLGYVCSIDVETH